LLEQLVRFDPNQRPSAFQALRHPYLDDLHDEDAAELKVEGAFRISTKNAGR
jgi:serine/threonine protein kinase